LRQSLPICEIGRGSPGGGVRRDRLVKATVRAVVGSAVALTSATAVAAVPPVAARLAYWSTPRAERSLVSIQPQTLSVNPAHPSSVVVSGSCKGVGRFRQAPHGVRLYHVFDCSLVVAYDGNGGLLVHVAPSRWCAYTHGGFDEIVRYGGGWVPGCG